MISVWPKFYPNTKNAQELMAKGYLYLGNLKAKEKDWVGKGYENTDYDPVCARGPGNLFPPDEGRAGRQGLRRLVDGRDRARHPLQPVDRATHRPDGPDRAGPGAASLFNSFPLVHAEGVADGLREALPDKRPFILTRSGFGGHPAHQLGALVGRHRRALGRSARPDLGRGQFVDVGGAQLDARYRRLRARGPLHQAGPSACRRMARAQPALVPVRRLLARCSAAMARRRSARSSRSPRTTRRCTIDGLVRPASLPADALHLHASPPTPGTRTAR
jgi:hypothetical protein